MFQVYVCVHVNMNYCGLQPNTIAQRDISHISYSSLIQKSAFFCVSLLHPKIIKQLKSSLLSSVHIFSILSVSSDQNNNLLLSSLVKLSNFHMHLQKTLVTVSNKFFYREKNYKSTMGDFLLILLYIA